MKLATGNVTLEEPIVSGTSRERALQLAWLIGVGWLLLLVRAPYRTNIDTPTYVGHSPLRTPVCPLFWDIMHALAGTHTLWLAHATQLALAFLAAGFLARTARQLFALPVVAEAAAFLLLAAPSARGGDMIATECLAYAAFIFFVNSFARALQQVSVSRLAVLALAIFLVIGVRPQFLFVWPTLLLFAAWVWYRYGSAGDEDAMNATAIGLGANLNRMLLPRR